MLGRDQSKHEQSQPLQKRDTPNSGRIVPVLLSGGVGSRLWPLSRETYPKQLLALLDDHTLLQQAAMRVADKAQFSAPMVIANAEHRFVIAEQLRSLGVNEPKIVLEPVGRNTAPAGAVAALVASEADPDALLLAMPVDHLVRDVKAFHAAVATATAAAKAGKLVLFGIEPTTPATGYGYIEVDRPLDGADGVRGVARFVEKPALAVAEQFLVSGDYLWNSGIFLLPARVFLQELDRLAPDVLKCCRAALAGAKRDLDFLRLYDKPFAECPAISLDYAVMEKTDRAAVVPAAFDWSDIGSWSALWAIGDKDQRGNVEIGDVVSENASGCYLRGDGPLVAALGVEDLIVAATPDVVLVTSRKHDQDVGKLVERLKLNGHRSATQTQCVYRPWGYYQLVHAGDRFQVKRITVNPGSKLSLQKHFHRAEHWVVVNGTALVTRDNDHVLLRENESIFIPLGAMHRLENPGKLPLNLIEVQSGAYLGEDDIVRTDDIYNRVAPGAERLTAT
jgi:mannose-1-phosphate guanylyltransferase/mannose-1-phosphate guanylyltransferase/mannose-6-phosphate isomerase